MSSRLEAILSTILTSYGMKQKLIDYLFELSLLGVMLRSFIVGASISDALVIITLILAIVYKKDFLIKKKVDDKAELESKIQESQSLLKTDIDILKNEIMSLKIDKGFKMTSNPMLKSPQMGTNEQIRRF